MDSVERINLHEVLILHISIPSLRSFSTSVGLAKALRLVATVGAPKLNGFKLRQKVNLQ